MEKKIPTDFTAMGKKIKETLDGRVDNICLVEDGIEIEDTDFNLSMKDDYLWDEVAYQTDNSTGWDLVE